MALPKAYEQYNNSKILTASKPELTLMLYEGAIKFCNIAIVAIEQKNIEKAFAGEAVRAPISSRILFISSTFYPIYKNTSYFY